MTGAEGAEDVRALVNPSLSGKPLPEDWQSRRDGDSRERSRVAALERHLDALIRARHDSFHVGDIVDMGAFEDCDLCEPVRALLEGGSRDAPMPTEADRAYLEGWNDAEDAASRGAAARPPVDPPLDRERFAEAVGRAQYADGDWRAFPAMRERVYALADEIRAAYEGRGTPERAEP